jgi:hypothetical protein
MSREFEQRYILGPDPRVLQYRDRQGDHQSAASRSTWPEARVVTAPTIKPLRFSISAWPMKHSPASFARSFAEEAGIGVGGRSMRIIGPALTMKVALAVAIGSQRLARAIFCPEAL